MNHRPIVLGIVGDSGAGKTTLTRGIAQILGQENITVIGTDDYHRYDRAQRAELGITALHPDCNYLTNPDLGRIIGTTGESLQSYPLALTQLLITYHMLKQYQ
jgi:phosphoribulokinase